MEEDRARAKADLSEQAELEVSDAGAGGRLREVTIRVGMSAEQCALYGGLISAYLHATANNAPRKTGEGLNMLMRLRMVCNHPSSQARSDDSDDSDPVARSGKLWALDRLLDRLRRRGARRVVIAVQMTRMLGILEEWLAWGRVATLRLDGSTPLAKRVEAAEAFRKGGPGFLAFLLSARAGGIGMDLSAADALVIVDPNWDTRLERALVDRVGGQTRPVTVVRLITAGSVEEKLVQMRSVYENLGEDLFSKKGSNDDRIAAIVAHRANDFLNSACPCPVSNADVARAIESAFPVD